MSNLVKDNEHPKKKSIMDVFGSLEINVPLKPVQELREQIWEERIKERMNNGKY